VYSKVTYSQKFFLAPSLIRSSWSQNRLGRVISNILLSAGTSCPCLEQVGRLDESPAFIGNKAARRDP